MTAQRKRDWRLRKLRVETGLTAQQFAERDLPCSYTHLRLVETGVRIPSPELAAALAKALSARLGREVQVSEFVTLPEVDYVSPFPPRPPSALCPGVTTQHEKEN